MKHVLDWLPEWMSSAPGYVEDFHSQHAFGCAAQVVPALLRHRVAAPVVDKNGEGGHLRSLSCRSGSAGEADKLRPDAMPVLGAQVPAADGSCGFSFDGNALLNRHVPITGKPRRHVPPVCIAKTFCYPCLPAEHVGSTLERSLMWEVQCVHTRKSKQV